MSSSSDAVDWSHMFDNDQPSFSPNFIYNPFFDSSNAFFSQALPIDELHDFQQSNSSYMDPHSFDSPSLSTPITFQPKAELILFDQPPTFLRDIPGDFSVTLPGVKHVTPLLIAHPSPLPPTAPGPSRPSRPHREPPERPPRGGRKFPCGASGCSRILTKQSLWKQHQRVHTHEKPFSCEFNNCGGKFANRFNLNRHYTTCKVKKALSSPTSTCVGSPSDDGTSI